MPVHLVAARHGHPRGGRGPGGRTRHARGWRRGPRRRRYLLPRQPWYWGQVDHVGARGVALGHRADICSVPAAITLSLPHLEACRATEFQPAAADRPERHGQAAAQIQRADKDGASARLLLRLPGCCCCCGGGAQRQSHQSLASSPPSTACRTAGAGRATRRRPTLAGERRASHDRRTTDAREVHLGVVHRVRGTLACRARAPQYVARSPSDALTAIGAFVFAISRES